MTDINTPWFLFAVIAGIVLVCWLLFDIDELLGIPIVSSCLAGLTTGALVYSLISSTLISINVGVAVAILTYVLSIKLKSSLTSTDLNSHKEK